MWKRLFLVAYGVIAGQIYFSCTQQKEESSDNDASSSDSFEIEDDSNRSRYFLEESGPTCFTCGKKGHVNRNCPNALVGYRE